MATTYEVGAQVLGEDLETLRDDVMHQLRQELALGGWLGAGQSLSVEPHPGGVFVAFRVDADDASLAKRQAVDLLYRAVTSAGADGASALFDVVVRSSS